MYTLSSSNHLLTYIFRQFLHANDFLQMSYFYGIYHVYNYVAQLRGVYISICVTFMWLHHCMTMYMLFRIIPQLLHLYGFLPVSIGLFNFLFLFKHNIVENAFPCVLHLFCVFLFSLPYTASSLFVFSFFHILH